ncbi:MAG: glycosyltransferase family 9 protein [Pirellulales bacterium]|nr:glycosyltransferase family 9 protein [Pirellulales bacterium]
MSGASSPRILITRLSAIGDCVHTLPLACALRRAFPEAFIAWAVEPLPAQLIEGHDAIDETIVVPKKWLKKWSTIRAVRRQLRALKFDTVLDAQSLSKSCLLGWLSGARRRIGFGAGQGRELALWMNNTRVKPTAAHVVDRYLEVAGPLGIESPEVEFRMKCDAASKDNIERFLDQSSLTEPIAVINPGAGWASKVWPAERYAAVAKHLGEQHQHKSVVVWVGQDERTSAELIVERSAGHARLAPPTSLLDLSELCRRANLFVGSDTGPLHIAAAVGTRCVGMYGPTEPEKCGPYGEGHVTVRAHAQSEVKKMRNADNDIMQSITADEVVEACDRALADGAASDYRAA